MSEKVEKTEAEWRAQLSQEEFEVCRKKGTTKYQQNKVYVLEVIRFRQLIFLRYTVVVSENFYLEFEKSYIRQSNVIVATLPNQN